MEYEAIPSMADMRPLRVTDEIAELTRAQEVEAAVRARLAALNKGRLVQGALFALPVVIALVSFLGGLATVYASTDCKGTDFGTYSRAFLYTSLSHALVAPILNWLVGLAVLSLLRHPTLAYSAYCAQAAVLACFLTAMVVLLLLVYRSACPSVWEKINGRLRR